MADRYEKRTKDELIELCKLRTLRHTGKKPDLVQRLVESDQTCRTRQSNRVRKSKATTPPDGIYFEQKQPGLCFFKEDEDPHMRSTNLRISKILARKYGVRAALKVVRGAAADLWKKESRGRELPALVYRGHIIADANEIRKMIESDYVAQPIDDACRRAWEKGLVDPDDSRIPGAENWL